MPYPGIKDEDVPRMEKCVESFITLGYSKSSAIAICHTSITGKKEVELSTKEFDISELIRELDKTINDNKGVFGEIPNSISDPSIEKYTDEYVIVKFDDKEFQVGYTVIVDKTESNNGEIILSLDDPIEVEKTWIPKVSSGGLFGAMKSLLFKEKLMRSESDGKHPSSHYLVVEDPSSSSKWHLRVRDVSGKPDHTLMGAAWAALHGGYRGNKYSGPSSSTALAKLKKLYASENMKIPSDKSLKDGGILIWKDKEQYRWFTMFTNKYRDIDNPPEILASKAHKDYVEAVEKGEYPYPELWHWHIKGTKWGTGDWVCYDDENGITMASGTVDKGHEKEAIAMQDIGIPIKVSHGMPIDEIQRNDKDKTVITRYRTREISDLPDVAAANQLTTFAITKENDMAIPENKKEYLVQAGLGQADIEDIETTAAAQAKKAQDLNLQSKEKMTVEPSVESPIEKDKPLDREEVVQALTKLTAIIEQNTKAMADSITGLQGELTEIKERIATVEKPMADQVALKATQTPMASLADLIVLSAIGRKETEVRAKDKLDTSPAAPPKEDNGGLFFSQWLSQPQQ